MRQLYYRLTIVAALAVLAMQASAADVDAATAQSLASKFMQTSVRGKLMSRGATVQLAHVEKSSQDASVADYYVFNTSDGAAYVIVAGDDRAEQILGYGNGRIDMATIPGNVRWWLDGYKRQMEYLRTLKEDGPSKPREPRAPSRIAPVEPLLTSLWNQVEPYCLQCPKYQGEYCATGCIATAMAQVINYWKYPSELPALPSYVTNTLGMTVPALPGGRIDWDNMLDVYNYANYTPAQADAVAMLMRYCGQACHMGYGTSASGAYSDDELTGMKLLGYNAEATLLSRNDYTADEWAGMIEAQLAAGCPILYGGVDRDRNMGHGFVVDGCGGGMYHVNWGYSGSGDGYFVLDAFTTMGYTFSSEQEMLYQIYPTGYLYDKYAAVMGEASHVTSTSFTADWSDETPSEYVTGYTLYVQPYDPSAHEVLLNETFGGIDVNIDETTALAANKVGNYCDDPNWTGSFVYLGDGGCFIVGGQKYVGKLTTPPLSVGDDGVITVRFWSRYSGSNSSNAIVTCNGVEQVVELSRTAKEYAIVFENVEAGATVTFTSTGRYMGFYLDDVVVTTGDDRDPVEMGDCGDGCLVFPDVATTDYSVTGLTTGGTYRYLVVTHYADGTTKKSNSQVVTLSEQPEHPYESGDVNHDGVVSVADVTMLISAVLSGSDICMICADMNEDNILGVGDVTALISRVLAGE